jgi:hypothetical protein
MTMNDSLRAKDQPAGETWVVRLVWLARAALHADGLGQVVRQSPNLPLGLAEQLVVLVDRHLGDELR